MKVCKEVINKCIKEASKRLDSVNYLLNANPVSRLYELEIEAISIVKNNQGNYEDISRLLQPLQIEKEEMKKLYEKSKDGISLINEQVDLEIEIGNLKNTLLLFKDRNQLK